MINKLTELLLSRITDWWYVMCLIELQCYYSIIKLLIYESYYLSIKYICIYIFAKRSFYIHTCVWEILIGLQHSHQLFFFSFRVVRYIVSNSFCYVVDLSVLSIGCCKYYEQLVMPNCIGASRFTTRDFNNPTFILETLLAFAEVLYIFQIIILACLLVHQKFYLVK